MKFFIGDIILVVGHDIQRTTRTKETPRLLLLLHLETLIIVLHNRDHFLYLSQTARTYRIVLLRRVLFLDKLVSTFFFTQLLCPFLVCHVLIHLDSITQIKTHHIFQIYLLRCGHLIKPPFPMIDCEIVTMNGGSYRYG